MTTTIDTVLNDQEKKNLMNAIKNSKEYGEEEQIYLQLEKIFMKYPSKYNELENEIVKLFKHKYQEKPDTENDFSDNKLTGGLVRCITKSTSAGVPTYSSDNPVFKLPTEFARFDVVDR